MQRAVYVPVGSKALALAESRLKSGLPFGHYSDKFKVAEISKGTIRQGRKVMKRVLLEQYPK